MMIATKADFARALERLRGRDPESLAAFIVSLAQDSGPIGEQVRTFIVGDNVAETVESLRARIGPLRIREEYEHRHARGREMGASLEFIVESIESLVMSVDPKRAFELLVLFFESDGVAMENCGDHDFEVTCAFERAAGLIGKAARSLPAAEVAAALEPRLITRLDTVNLRTREIYLAHRSGYSYAEIAEHVNIAKITAERHIARAQAILVRCDD
jgi:hypothetical protein